MAQFSTAGLTNYQNLKADNKISSANFTKNVKPKLYHIENSKTRWANSVDLDEVAHNMRWLIMSRFIKIYCTNSAFLSLVGKELTPGILLSHLNIGLVIAMLPLLLSEEIWHIKHCCNTSVTYIMHVY